MSEKLLKITYHDAADVAGKKLNAYLRMPSNTFHVQCREIETYLCQKGIQLPKREFRTYWIDADSDEIEIINQNDYEIFLEKCKHNLHMQISAIPEKTEDKEEKNEDDPSNFVIHDTVECDGCGVAPLVGFRYKCVQCANFDLCQRCEGAHKHADHIMVRIPTKDGPSVVQAWLSGPGASSSHHHRRYSRRFRGQCPFTEATAASPQAGASASDSHKESRREKRHGRRGGFLSQFVEMMINMPENNSPLAATAVSAVNINNKAEEKEQATDNLQSKEDQKDSISNPANEITKKPSPVVTGVKANDEEDNIEAQHVKETAKAQPSAAPRNTPASSEVKDGPQGMTAEPKSTADKTPTTPVFNLENLVQAVNPEYMRAGIEILNNFSEMFAKIIEPSESTSFESTDTSIASGASTAFEKLEVSAQDDLTSNKQATLHTSMDHSLSSQETQTETNQTVGVAATTTREDSSVSASPVATAAADLAVTPNAVPEERRRSDSFDHDWQMIDNTVAPPPNASTVNVLINTSSPSSTTTDSDVTPVRDFKQLGEKLRQHVNEEQQRERTTTHTQTPQVDTMSTSTSTTSVATNSTSTSTASQPAVPSEKRAVPVYHTDERINGAVHAMMAMGFSNEGAWLTQLLESVDGDIPAALDVMHASQHVRN